MRRAYIFIINGILISNIITPNLLFTIFGIIITILNVIHIARKTFRYKTFVFENHLKQMYPAIVDLYSGDEDINDFSSKVTTFIFEELGSACVYDNYIPIDYWKHECILNGNKFYFKQEKNALIFKMKYG